MMEMSKLPACGYSMPSNARPELEDDCGEPAVYRATWDGGKTWLFLCDRHARHVERADEEAAVPERERP